MIGDLIKNVNYQGLRDLLFNNPPLAHEGIPFDENNAAEAHPLHRICDGVFEKQYTDEQALEMAKIFLKAGADINGFGLMEKQDTPLIAAASLHADEVALFYIENGAAIHHAGCHGGTALHWAAWCGRARVVKRLLQEDIAIDQTCADFGGTPLFWAVHGLKHGGEKNRYEQVECARLLVQAGADKSIPNKDGSTVLDLLDESDIALQNLLQM